MEFYFIFFCRRKVAEDGRERVSEKLPEYCSSGRWWPEIGGSGGWLWLVEAVPDLKKQLGCDGLGPVYGLEFMNLVDQVEVGPMNGLTWLACTAEPG